MSTCKKIILFFMLSLFFSSSPQPVYTQEAKKVYTILLTDLNTKDAWLPFIGEYPVVIVYEDFRNLGNTEEFYLKTMKNPELYNKLKLIYISNIQPAWYTPEFIIYHLLKKREAEYSGITFLVDRHRSLQKKWRLSDSDGKSVIILVNREAKIIDIDYHTPGAKGLDKIFESLWSIIDF